MTDNDNDSLSSDPPASGGSNTAHGSDRRKRASAGNDTLDHQSDFLKRLANRNLSSLQDAFSDRSHSRDFAYARCDYVRNRVKIISLLFLALLPGWWTIDLLVLAPESMPIIHVGRLIMACALIITYLLARCSKSRPQLARLSAGLLLAIPAAFYALVLATLTDPQQSLIGYSFIPFMLVTMLAIFPFTLLESFVLGTGLVLLQVYALYATTGVMTGEGLQQLWLLAALLSITLTANYFQLGLLLRLYREATHDPLTGLLNRGALIRTVLQTLRRYPAPQMALLIMDMDYFKRINDTYGHAFGDDVLRSFARALRASLRQGDIAARYGGEEFMAVLVDIDRPSALAIAERIRRRTEQLALKTNRGEIVHPTVSIGVAMLKPGESFEEAAKRADNRLYDAKRLSRNCVVGIDISADTPAISATD